MWLLVLLAVALSCEAQVLRGNGGIVDPGPVHQRFRGDDASFRGQNFFQWWFFWLRAPDGTHFTMHYAMSRVDSPASNNGGFVGFSFVNETGGTRGTRVDRFAEGMNVSAASAPLYCHVSVGTRNSMTPLDNETMHLTGSLDVDSDQIFHSTDNLKVGIEWDVKVKRVEGWYGEAGLVDLLADTFGRGMISWNPYAHASIASGTVRIGGVVYDVVPGNVPNAYGDMNWGRRFPIDQPRRKRGLDRREYAWGWYSMQTASGASLIVGLGLTETGFPAYSIFGGFADLYFGPGKGRVSLRYVAAEYGSPLQGDILNDSSDGSEVRAFSVARSQWTNYTDSLGTVSVPLQQTLHLQTETLDFTATCVATVARTNRLLFPFEYVFSDFETLGACCQFRAVVNGTVVLQDEDCHAGVEYGRN